MLGNIKNVPRAGQIFRGTRQLRDEQNLTFDESHHIPDAIQITPYPIKISSKPHQPTSKWSQYTLSCLLILTSWLLTLTSCLLILESWLLTLTSCLLALTSWFLILASCLLTLTSWFLILASLPLLYPSIQGLFSGIIFNKVKVCIKV